MKSHIRAKKENKMNNYIRAKNEIGHICNVSGLSPEETAGVLSECLAEIRQVLCLNATAENLRLTREVEALKAELTKLKKPVTEDSAPKEESE